MIKNYYVIFKNYYVIFLLLQSKFKSNELKYNMWIVCYNNVNYLYFTLLTLLMIFPHNSLSIYVSNNSVLLSIVIREYTWKLWDGVYRHVQC